MHCVLQEVDHAGQWNLASVDCVDIAVLAPLSATTAMLMSCQKPFMACSLLELLSRLSSRCQVALTSIAE